MEVGVRTGSDKLVKNSDSELKIKLNFGLTNFADMLRSIVIYDQFI